SVVAVAMAVLAIIAYLQRNRAKEQAMIATSGHLATAALLNKDDALDLASLLSLEGARMHEGFEGRNALLTTFQANPRLQAYLHHPAKVTSVAYSPDGKLLASGTYDGRVWVWNMASRQLVGKPLVLGEERVHRVVFSPDGKVLAGAAKRVKLWNVANWQMIGKEIAPDQRDFDLGVAFSPDGNSLATAGRRICLWSVHDQNLIKEFTASSPRAHIANGEHEVAFSPDGKILVSGGGDPLVRLWDIATGYRIEEPVPSNVGASFFSFIGSDTLAWVDRTLVLLDLTTRQRRPEHV